MLAAGFWMLVVEGIYPYLVLLPETSFLTLNNILDSKINHI